MLMNYIGFLVNEGIGIILLKQTFCPSSLSVHFSKDIYPILLLCDPLLFLLLYLNHIMLYKTLSYHFHTQFVFYFIDIMVYIYLST